MAYKNNIILLVIVIIILGLSNGIIIEGSYEAFQLTEPVLVNSSNETMYSDPLYGYNLELLGNWYIIPTVPDAIYGAAVFMNFDWREYEKTRILPDNSLKIQIGVAPLWDSWSFEQWATAWQASEIIHGAVSSETLNPIHFKQYQGYSFNLEPNWSEDNQLQYVMETILDIGNNRVMIIAFSATAPEDLLNVFELLSDLDVSQIKPFPSQIIHFPPPSLTKLLETSANFQLSHEPEIVYGQCPIGGTFPGNNTPNAPFTLYMPFRAGQKWRVGGDGSFYGNNFHCNDTNVNGAGVNGDHYATDWNRADGGPEENADVLPVADGDVKGLEIPTCPGISYGCYVIVEHTGNIRTLYAHLNNVYVVQNQTGIHHWDRIGSVGGTGGVFGAVHLHLSILQATQGVFHSLCAAELGDCATGETPVPPQTIKPSPMYTLENSGLSNLEDGHIYTSINADGFGFPLNPPDGIGYGHYPHNGYDVQNDKLLPENSCFGVDRRQLWHAGEDWFDLTNALGLRGEPVFAVADGIVKYISSANYNYPGAVVIVEHQLVNDTVYSMYGHLDKDHIIVQMNQSVIKSQQLGQVLDQGLNSHLHWEIRSFEDGSNICPNSGPPGPGYTYPQHPGEMGYYNPSAFVQNATGDSNSKISVALIIDATGSMAWNDPNGLRKEAAKAFIDLTQIGDKIAIVAFDAVAYHLQALLTIQSDADRATLKAAVDQIGDWGGTNLNAGLDGGFAELTSDTSLNRKAAIFLTDGLPSYPYNPQSHLQYQAQGWPVYTIGLSEDADEELLMQIADETNGTYTQLSNPSDLQPIYFELSQQLVGGNVVLEDSFVLTQGNTQLVNAYLTQYQASATFFVSWEGSEVSSSLVSPGGRQIDASTNSPDVYHVQGATYEIYTVQYPEMGEWTMNVTGVSLPAGGEQVNVRVASEGPTYVYMPVVAHYFDAIPQPPPYQPYNPSPFNGATNQPLDVSVSWAGGDPANEPVTYDIYFGFSPSGLNPVYVNATNPSFYPGPLEEAMTYYWQVLSRDAHGATSLGPVWSFTTSGSITVTPPTTTPNPSRTPTATPTIHPTITPSATHTATVIRTPTNTATSTPVPPTSTPTIHPTITAVATNTATTTRTPTTTATSTPIPPTLTSVPTATPSVTNTATATRTPTNTATPTPPPTSTPIPTPTSTFTPLPTATPTIPAPPSPITLLSSSTNNGGFETGNMSGWSQADGVIDVTGDFVHSGNYSVHGSSGGDVGQPSAKFHRTFSVDAYQIWIDAGLGIASYSGWFHTGASESFRYRVQFRDQFGTTLATFDTDWIHNPSGDPYHQYGEQRAIPAGTRTIYVEVSMSRTSGSYTDVDVDDMDLVIQFNNP